MMPGISGFSEMAAAKLCHLRRNACAARLFDALSANHTGSFSSTVGNAGRQAAHRLFAQEDVTPAALLSGHVLATAERARSVCELEEWLLILQDTTDFDYSNHLQTSGLGSIGMGRSLGSGLQSHGALAVSPSGLPLGVVDLCIWARPKAEEGKTKAEKHRENKTRPTDQKESKKWVDCMERVQAKFPPGVKLLFVQDREADMFDLFTEPRRAGTDLLVRAAQPRIVEIVSDEADAAGLVCNVFDAVRSAAVLGQLQVEVGAKTGAPARTAVVDIRARRVLLRAPKGRPAEADRTPRPLWLVSAREADPPEGVAPLDWTLITTIPAPTFETACRLVTYYSRRWLIERLHFVLKSGLKAEGLRFDDAHSLKNALTLYYMVAWRLLYLTYLARMDPNQPAAETLEPIEIEVLSQVEQKPVATLASAVIAIAKLGGYNHYPKAGPPGVKLIWLGIRKLEGMVAGYLLAMAHFKEVIH